jgi:hypothetical protein
LQQQALHSLLAPSTQLLLWLLDLLLCKCQQQQQSGTQQAVQCSSSGSRPWLSQVGKLLLLSMVPAAAATPGVVRAHPLCPQAQQQLLHMLTTKASAIPTAAATATTTTSSSSSSSGSSMYL